MIANILQGRDVMEVRLVVERGGKRRTFTLQAGGSVIGRARGCSVRVPSAEVSRQHCRLRDRDGVVEVEDLDSVNGTFLNGQRVLGRVVIRPGDKLEVGPVRFIVEYELTPAALEQLQGDDEPVSDFLDGLADGSVLGSGELDVVDDAPDLEVSAASLEEEDFKDLPLPKSEDEPIRPEFSFNQPWNMPEEGDLRDILSQMELDDKTPKPPTKPPRKKK